MSKKYEKPELEVEEFEVVDVITESQTTPPGYQEEEIGGNSAFGLVDEF